MTLQITLQETAIRGTKVHKICEDFLNNQNLEEHKKNFLPYIHYLVR